MGTKADPGPRDCHALAEDDEPLFTLLARDPLAPMLVESWVQFREQGALGTAITAEEAAEVREIASAMRAWRVWHP